MNEEVMVKSRIARYVLVAIGWIAVVLGVLGIFLPLLPTTPFLLLASGCFMRGSPRLNQWLYQHPQLGPILVNWHQHGAVTSVVKRRGLIMIVLSFTFSIAMVPLWWHKLMLLGGLVILLYCFNRLPVVDIQPDSSSVAEPEEKP
ncbi:Inner membrane protein YbaN [Photobacterium toruni]|uniref:Inner membrane protein n=2 Tax=Photobacterium toruni TaxID=1935446 RepID=A0A1T4KFP1_9GAMM|nr:Inner membrane protein YbaN [Photobacterium toruni]